MVSQFPAGPVPEALPLRLLVFFVAVFFFLLFGVIEGVVVGLFGKRLGGDTFFDV